MYRLIVHTRKKTPFPVRGSHREWLNLETAIGGQRLYAGGSGEAGGEHAFDVFGEKVELEVDAVAGGAGVEVGVGVGVRDDPAGEAVLRDFGDGEADAIDGDAAFIDEVVGRLGGEGDLEAVVGAVLGVVEEFGGGIDVALDEVSAHFGSGVEGGLEVDFAAELDAAEAGAAEGLGEEVKCEDVARDVGGGEAASVDGDAVAKLGGGGEGGRTEGEAGACVAGL